MGGSFPVGLFLLDELLPVLEVLEVEEAGEEAEEAVVRAELPSWGLELPLAGEAAADAATEDLDEAPGGEVRPAVLTALLVPAATSGVGLFLEVDVVRSWGDATPVEPVESAYLQLEAEGADGADAAWRSGVVGSWWSCCCCGCCWGWCCCGWCCCCDCWCRLCVVAAALSRGWGCNCV